MNDSDPDFDVHQLSDVPDPFADEPVPRLALVPPTSSSPTRAQVTRLRVAGIGLALLYDAALVAVMGLRPDIANVAPGALALAMSLPALAAVVATFASTGAAATGGPGRSYLALLSLTLFLSSLLAPLPGGVPASFLSAAAMCAVGAAMLAAGPLVLAVVTHRHAFASSAQRRTMALGLGCGALAAAAIELRCSTAGALHVLVGHGPVLVLGALAGLGLARFTRVLSGICGRAAGLSRWLDRPFGVASAAPSDYLPTCLRPGRRTSRP